MKVLGLNFEHDLEWESLQESELTSEIIRVFVDRNPNLHGIVRVLTIDLVKIEAIIHALLDFFYVLIVAFFKPRIYHHLYPTLRFQQIEADLTSEEFGYEKISLSLQVLNDLRVHLSEKLIQGALVIASFLNHIEGSLRDLSITYRSVMG